MEEMERIINVFEYSQEIFFNLLSERSKATKELIEEKIHSNYFDKYLQSKSLKVKTIVVEYNYIDRDYLEDFSAYYVRCFSDYERKCTRLHFFSYKFSLEDFESFLNNYSKENHETLNEKYLGFIVIKPLPQTIFGRTCLKIYDELDKPPDIRSYPTVREYEVNLCGYNLTVKSVAFQEQDHVVSACATSALWSAFQCTAKLFHHKILSPVEITKSATEHFPLSERTFPNTGLNIEQMMHAVQKLEIEPFVIDIEDDEYNFKNCIYSYLSFGIPIILCLELYETLNGKYINKGSHAVVITGFRLKEEDDSHKVGDGDCLLNNFHSVASKISKIYAHDDQIGPFAKMIMDVIDFPIEGEENRTIKTVALKTAWNYIVVPKTFLIPLYHKIRIPLENILEIMRLFDAIIKNSSEHSEDLMPSLEKYEWEIILTSVNKFKKEILLKSGGEKNRRDILQKNMPRFIWRVTALCEREPVMDLLFDATDIEQGDFFISGVVYNRELFSSIKSVINSDETVYSSLSINPTSKSMAGWIKNWTCEDL